EGASHERGSGIQLWTAARRLRSEETSGQSYGSQDRILTPLRVSARGPMSHDVAGGNARESHQPPAGRRQQTRTTVHTESPDTHRSAIRETPGRDARPVDYPRGGRISHRQSFFHLFS